MPARTQWRSPRLAVGVANAHSSRGVPSTLKAAYMDWPIMIADWIGSEMAKAGSGASNFWTT